MRTIRTVLRRHGPPLAQQDRAGDTDVAGVGLEAPVAVHFGFPACDEGITLSGRRASLIMRSLTLSSGCRCQSEIMHFPPDENECV